MGTKSRLPEVCSKKLMTADSVDSSTQCISTTAFALFWLKMVRMGLDAWDAKKLRWVANSVWKEPLAELGYLPPRAD